MKIENMGIIPKEEIDKLIKIMKRNNIDEMTFTEMYHTYQIESYTEHFDITIMDGTELIEQYRIYNISML